MDQASVFQRHIAFEAIDNFRDLGGYPSRYGGETVAGAVYRAATLHRASAADRQRLARLGVRHVIDLRSFPELARDGHLDPATFGASRLHAPVFPDEDASPAGIVERYRLYAVNLAAVYRMMLERGAPAYRQAVQMIAEAEGPLVFHCSGGKDRAGVLAALLLSLAGVEREMVLADYALTATHLPQPSEAALDALCRRFDLSRAEALALFATEPDGMATALTWLDATHTSAEGYLRAIGVSAATLSGLRDRLLDQG